MGLNEYIQLLIKMKIKFGPTIRVLVNHGEASLPSYVPAEDDCPAYVSLESAL